MAVCACLKGALGNRTSHWRAPRLRNCPKPNLQVLYISLDHALGSSTILAGAGLTVKELQATLLMAKKDCICESESCRLMKVSAISLRSFISDGTNALGPSIEATCGYRLQFEWITVWQLFM
jgi:hypothetical protein